MKKDYTQFSNDLTFAVYEWLYDHTEWNDNAKEEVIYMLSDILYDEVKEEIYDTIGNKMNDLFDTLMYKQLLEIDFYEIAKSLLE